ncbi:MAG TPA: hypothetical protein VK708_08185 [Bryobacteraceae bacterium]|jgi:hypothetical protein|nr:hypothetical protein [Bryobacteraceae bacterium]
MKHKLTIALAFAAGLLGGLLARYINPQPAFAQAVQGPAATKEVRAQSFSVVDPGNHVIGTLTWRLPTEPIQENGIALPPIPQIVLQDATGHQIWSPPSGTLFRQLSSK